MPHVWMPFLPREECETVTMGVSTCFEIWHHNLYIAQTSHNMQKH
jgi:hypothetical protein